MKHKQVEFIGFLTTFLVQYVIAPFLGKLGDSFYFRYPKIFTESILLFVLGLILVLYGSFIIIWAIVILRSCGEGTCDPRRPPKKLVISGPYKYVRHPMFSGSILALIGQAMVYFSPSLILITVLYGAVLYRNTVQVEEIELVGRFGDSYREYMKRVPRFILNPFKFLSV